MKPCPSRGKARYITAVVLCVWLLGLGTGVAHAYLCTPEPAHQAGAGGHPAQATQPQAATERMSPCPALELGPPSAWPLRPLSGSARQKSPPPAHAGLLRVAGITWHAPDRVDRIPARDGSDWIERPATLRFLRLLI